MPRSSNSSMPLAAVVSPGREIWAVVSLPLLAMVLWDGPIGGLAAVCAVFTALAATASRPAHRDKASARSEIVSDLDRAIARGQPTAAFVVEFAGRTLGERIGRGTLSEICADRLRDCVGPEGRVAPLDGSRLAVALPDCTGTEAALLAAQVRDALAAPVEVAGGRADLPVTVGFAVADALRVPTGRCLLIAASASRHIPHRQEAARVQ